MLLPPDLRQWVPEDDMVHFVMEAVAEMNLPTLKINRRGCGSEQYPPKMMLQLLIYCYANGIFSSRRIERASYRDVAVRFLTADTHPDHDTICTFRRENFEAVAAAFLQVLQLACTVGVLKVGTVSVDGTHIKASASNCLITLPHVQAMPTGSNLRSTTFPLPSVRRTKCWPIPVTPTRTPSSAWRRTATTYTLRSAATLAVRNAVTTSGLNR